MVSCFSAWSYTKLSYQLALRVLVWFGNGGLNPSVGEKLADLVAGFWFGGWFGTTVIFWWREVGVKRQVW